MLKMHPLPKETVREYDGGAVRPGPLQFACLAACRYPQLLPWPYRGSSCAHPALAAAGQLCGSFGLPV